MDTTKRSRVVPVKLEPVEREPFIDTTPNGQNNSCRATDARFDSNMETGEVPNPNENLNTGTTTVVETQQSNGMSHVFIYNPQPEDETVNIGTTSTTDVECRPGNPDIVLEALKMEVAELKSTIAMYELDAEKLRLENGSLRSQLQFCYEKLFSADHFKDDAEGMHFYTGFQDYNHFKQCFDQLTRGETSIFQKGALSPLNQFFLVMIKYKLGLLDQDLAVRFGIPASNVSSLRDKWMKLMHVNRSMVESWPLPASVLETVVISFAKLSVPNLHTRIKSELDNNEEEETNTGQIV